MHQPKPNGYMYITYLYYITKYEYYMNGVFCDKRKKNGRYGNRARKTKIRYSRFGEYFPVVFILHNAMHTWASVWVSTEQKRPVVHENHYNVCCGAGFFGRYETDAQKQNIQFDVFIHLFRDEKKSRIRRSNCIIIEFGVGSFNSFNNAHTS